MNRWRVVGLGVVAICLVHFGARAATGDGFVAKVQNQAVEDLLQRAKVSRSVMADLVRQGGEAYARAAMYILQSKDADPKLKADILDNLYVGIDPREVSQWLEIEPEIIAADIRLTLGQNVSAEELIASGKVPDLTKMPPIISGTGKTLTAAPSPGAKITTKCVKDKMAAAGFAGGGKGGGVTDPVKGVDSAGMTGGEAGVGAGGGSGLPGGFDRTTSGESGHCAGLDWSKIDRGGTIGNPGDTWEGNKKVGSNYKAVFTGTEVKSSEYSSGIWGTLVIEEYGYDGQVVSSVKSREYVVIKKDGTATITKVLPAEGISVTLDLKNTSSTPNPMEDGGGVSAKQACMNALNDCTTGGSNKGKEDCLKQFGDISKNNPVKMPAGPDGGTFNIDAACGGNLAGLDVTKMPNFGLTLPSPADSGESVQPGPGKTDCSKPDPTGKPKPGCGPGGLGGGGGAPGGGPAMKLNTKPSLWQRMAGEFKR